VEHVVPHAPQFIGSDVVSTHALLQTMPPAHGVGASGEPPHAQQSAHRAATATG
jgi:hypothetical protein